MGGFAAQCPTCHSPSHRPNLSDVTVQVQRVFVLESRLRYDKLQHHRRQSRPWSVLEGPYSPALPRRVHQKMSLLDLPAFLRSSWLTYSRLLAQCVTAVSQNRTEQIQGARAYSLYLWRCGSAVAEHRRYTRPCTMFIVQASTCGLSQHPVKRFSSTQPV